MPTPIREFLMKTPSLDGNPLFRNGADLARQITSIPFLGTQQIPNVYVGRIESATSFINQVLRSERSPSDQLKFAMVEAIQLRLEGQTEEALSKTLVRFHQLIDGLEEEHQLNNDALATTELIFEYAKTRTDQFVINPVTPYGEMRVAAHPMRSIMIERLGLYKTESSENNEATLLPEASMRITFCIADNERATEGWRRLFYQITGISSENPVGLPLSVQEAKEKIRELERTNALRIFAVPKDMCGLPLIVFDPLTDNAVGFLLQYNMDKGITPFPILPHYLADWKSTIYNRLFSGEIKSNRIMWETVEYAVVQEAESILRYR